MKRFLPTFVLLSFWLLGLRALGQNPYPTFPYGYGDNPSSQNPNPIVEEEAPPVTINGKKVEELSEEELLEFLQNKVRDIEQDDGQVEILRVAPGYPLVLAFSDPVLGWEVGDPKLLEISRKNSTLVLRPMDRSGDTTLVVFFSGNRTRPYHVFVEESFATGMTLLRVAPFDSLAHKIMWASGPDGQYGGVADIARVIQNYDLLVREKALSPREVHRIPIFKHSELTGFDYYYVYRFSSGPIAISFSWRNPFPYRVRLDESSLRVAIGNSRFIPDFVSVNHEVLPPGRATSGFLVLLDPPFHPAQPFKLVWKTE
ncbi:hypothetical protein [Candidatus Methylacidithermus pantelleriae]|uniref:Uncharacterized protein n=1 Tax=Candidatus Methylacidithermus pantelleriae TaxID=2744239 RepID=A0A8J2BLC4_9BACT|nr:hypothetical protein [Candidatus Methylacidithermus pantelleriae]CAF0704873.1 conserved hypothetical protein [Candidatus Methylacidithermus pantelleriae]